MRAFTRFPRLTLLVALAWWLAGAPAGAVSDPKTIMPSPEMLAGQVIQNLGDRVIKVLADKSGTPEQRAAQFHMMLRSSFDVEGAAKFVIGPAWDAITLEQQKEYLALIEALAVKIYGDRLSAYDGEKFLVTAVRPEGGSVYNVMSAVIYPSGKTEKVVWRLNNKEGRLAIEDVIIEDVSQLGVHRDQYAPIVQFEGIYALLDVMRQRLQNPAPSPAQQQ